MRAFLGSVNHQARVAERMRSVGTSDVQESHDMTRRSGRRGQHGRVLNESRNLQEGKAGVGVVGTQSDRNIRKGKKTSRFPSGPRFAGPARLLSWTGCFIGREKKMETHPIARKPDKQSGSIATVRARWSSGQFGCIW